MTVPDALAADAAAAQRRAEEAITSQDIWRERAFKALETLKRANDAAEAAVARAERLEQAMAVLETHRVHQAKAPLRPVWFRVYRDPEYNPTNAEARVICERVSELEGAIGRALALAMPDRAALAPAHANDGAPNEARDG